MWAHNAYVEPLDPVADRDLIRSGHTHKVIDDKVVIPFSSEAGALAIAKRLNTAAENAVGQVIKTRSGLPPLKLEPTVAEAKPIGAGEYEVTVFDPGTQARITGAFDSIAGDLHIEAIGVGKPYRERTLSDQLYETAINLVEKESGVTVQRVIGTPVLSNDGAARNPTATPRVHSLEKMGFTKHTYDADTDQITSER